MIYNDNDEELKPCKWAGWDYMNFDHPPPSLAIIPYTSYVIQTTNNINHISAFFVRRLVLKFCILYSSSSKQLHLTYLIKANTWAQNSNWDDRRKDAFIKGHVPQKSYIFHEGTRLFQAIKMFLHKLKRVSVSSLKFLLLNCVLR